VRNACGIAKLAEDLGAGPAREVFDDFRFSDDAEAPRKTDRPFPFLTDLGPVDAAAVPELDCASLEPVAPPTLPSDGTTVDVPLVGELPTARRSARTIDLPVGPDGDPAPGRAVQRRAGRGRPHRHGGSDRGHGAADRLLRPQLFWERSVQAPGILRARCGHRRGGSAITIGRGDDYAWSVTSGNGDNVDQFVLELCEPGGGEPTTDSLGYVRGDDCVEISSTRRCWSPSPVPEVCPAPTDPTSVVIRKYFERAARLRPDRRARTLADGTPIAVARARTTYLDETAATLSFTGDQRRAGCGDFEAFARHHQEGYTYNWCGRPADIGSDVGAPARRTPGSTRLPSAATADSTGPGAWARTSCPRHQPEWGYLSPGNNKAGAAVAGPPTADSAGAGARSQAARPGSRPSWRGRCRRGAGRRRRARQHTDCAGRRSCATSCAHGRRANVDVDPRTAEMLATLEPWMADGSHRRDHDRDGAYEHATAIAVVDRWWEPLVDAVLRSSRATSAGSSVSRCTTTTRTARPSRTRSTRTCRRTCAPCSATGRRPVLPGLLRRRRPGAVPGRPVDLAQRRRRLLEEEFDSPSVADWTRAPEDEQIEHGAIGLTPSARCRGRTGRPSRRSSPSRPP
jgi:hypothetical protein